jgi:two-component system CheB/CheR fusion protein
MWGLRADEAEGKSLLNLDIGLPVEKLRGAIRPFLAGQSDHSSIILDAINRRGKPIKCRITCSPLVTPNKGPQGVIVLMEEDTA